MKEQYHILTLNSDQQASLRYCLYTYTQQRVVGLLETQVAGADDNKLHLIGSEMMDILKNYDLVCTLLSPFQGHDSFKGKTRMLMYNETFWKFITASVNGWNLRTAELVVGEKLAYQINAQMSGLTKLVNESSLYTFSADEIKKESANK